MTKRKRPTNPAPVTRLPGTGQLDQAMRQAWLELCEEQGIDPALYPFGPRGSSERPMRLNGQEPVPLAEVFQFPGKTK